MNLTIDQLTYILERKYTNIKVGGDVLIVCTVTRNPEDGTFTPNNDAHIIEWYVPHISKPTVDELANLWDILKDQYNSDPVRPDSEMAIMLRKNEKNGKPKITVNPDI